MSMKNTHFKKALSLFLAVVTVLSCWVWVAPEQAIVSAAAETLKDHYLFAYFTGTSKEGQTIHLAVSKDGYQYTALRNNEPVIIPSKGVGSVRDPYIWYNEQDNYYYILATDLDFTDGGGTYSNNSQSFIVWRSKDLVTWYDETFIDVAAMAHIIGDTRGMTAVWAPQVLWDGSAYVVYFTLCCNATGQDGTGWNNMQLVYLKTTDIMDQNAYYEYGVLFDPNYHVIDADIIQNPNDGLYYLFYKNEDWEYDSPTTDLKTIHYLVSENACGPYSTVNPQTGASIDTNGDGRGYRVYPNTTVSLEGCNSYFDNEGYLVTYTDEYGYTNAVGEAEAHFHISRTTDFKTFTMLDDSVHNINSLSPRHGSVVKITEEEYNRLLNNSYNVSSSSFPDTETLEDHLVARFFTTENVLENTVVGQPDLASSTNVTMKQDVTGEWYADFASGWAEIDFDSLFVNGLNYQDGFTITFSALNFPMSSDNSENNDRIYEIADTFGSRTGTEHYTHFSPSGGGNGSYIGNYNGPVDSGNDWLSDINGANRDDGCIHEYIISYATGNVKVYVDGELTITRNRFTGVNLDDSWYKALGSNSTMRIGRSGWDADPLFVGYMQDLCVYDCSMSYYDAISLDEDLNVDNGFVGEREYSGITSQVPTFSNATADQMESLRGTNFSNILYTSGVSGTPSGDGEGANPNAETAAAYSQGNDTKAAVYYPENTVLLLDGINPALMPVMMAGRVNAANKDRYIYNMYPTNGYGSNQDNSEIHLNVNWVGWNSSAAYHETIKNPDGTDHQIGYKAGASGKAAKLAKGNSQSARKIYYYANTLQVDEANIDFGQSYYKKFNLTWQWYGGSNTTYTETDSVQGHMYSDHNIYVIDFRPILELREAITEDAYNAVMNNTALCPELRESYASAVYDIRTLNPINFGFDEAPETATKACAKAIGEAVSTYEGVMAEIARQEAAGTYGHNYAEFESREATCAVTGLTSGKYCTICGEIFEEQEVIASLPHTFGDVFTENGIQYRECSVCGVRIEYKPYEVRYENLFSLNRWVETSSYSTGFSGATLTADLANGTIYMNNPNSTEIYNNASGGEKNFACNSIPVSGGRTYVLEYTATGGYAGQVFVFKYNKDGALTGTYDDTQLTASGTSHLEFTVESNTAYIELRFDANAAGSITYSQIGVYEKEDFEKFGVTTADARLAFYPGEDKALCYPNPVDGYVFDGWYTEDGVEIENVNELNNPTTIVYGKWIAAGYDVVYDSIFSFSDWAKSSCNQLWYGDDKSTGSVVRLVSKEGILADAENGTITITNDEDTTNFARTNYWVDTANVHTMTVEPNTDYVIEYTATSSDGAKPSICAYFTGGTATYPETGAQTRYGLGTQRVTVNSGENNTKLTLRFDNVQHGSTVTYSDIAVYKADFLEAAQTITNRQYRRYYPQQMGIGDLFEYTPVRPGFVFDTWMADTNGDMIGDFNLAGFDDAFIVSQNWHVFSTWIENNYTIAYNANGGSGSAASQTVKYTQDVTLASSGFTKTGYTLIGWSTAPGATVATYQLGQTTNRLCGDTNGTITLYAVWKANDINVTFDNLIDFSAWNKTAGNGTMSNVTDTGFTITSNSGVSESTSSSAYFAVEPGKSYKVDIDVTGTDWDVYVFFCAEDGSWVDFKDSTNRYSSNGSGNSTRVFTAPDKTEVVKAQIRVDANGSNNTVTFNNIRVYEDTDITVSPVNKYVTYDSAYGTLPTPKKSGYEFIGWFDSNGTQVTASSILAQASTVYLNSKWVIADSALTADAYVLDFGLKAEFSPLDNDTILKADGGTYSLSGVSTDGKTASGSVTGAYGTFTVSGDKVVYTPTAVMNGSDVVYYHVSYNNGAKTIVNTITVIPATVVYYEDDYASVVTYTDGVSANGSTGSWTTVGSSKLASASQSVADDVYGYDTTYANATDTYSMGSSHYVSVSKYNNPNSKYSGSEGNSWPVAEFTFAGTGFDLVSLIGKNTGTIEVKVLDANGNKVYDWIVDTYYGYTVDENGKWVVNADADTSIYQIPVISRNDLAYDTYTVQIIPTYTTRLDHQKDGAYDFCLDAVRVYNPCGDDYDAASVYMADGEYLIAHESIRDILIEAKDLNASDASATGIVYINPGVTAGTFEQYSSAGPKNEVYLAQGQSIAFSMTVTGAVPSSVQVSAHAINGTASMRFASGESYSDVTSISHKTTLYYEMPFMTSDYWTDNGDGTYTTKTPIVITNNGSGLLSLCNIKVTADGTMAAPVMFMMSRSTFDLAAATAENVSGLSSEDEGVFVPETVENETEAETVVVGDEYIVTVTTSSDVAALTVNGENAVLVSANDDGTKTWSYSYHATDRGEQTLTLVAYNADGIASEETTLTVEVESRLEHFFSQLAEFFKLVIEFIRSFKE